MKKFRRKKKKDTQGERFLDNGSKMLRELVAACDGKTNPIRSFSSDQILKATNNFDHHCIVCDWDFPYYKGYIEDRFYIIKNFRERDFPGQEGMYNDLVVSARVSDHKNLLRLVGCCLEFPVPVLVFEYAEYGALDPRGRINGSEGLLPWNVRLKIAKEVANAVTYLHTAFPRIIIHRNIKPNQILLDKNWSPKLYDFSLSISPPEGKSQIEDQVCGTFGFVDPEYFNCSIVTEYTDVYSFGILLLVLLTGEKALPWYPGAEQPTALVVVVKRLKENGVLIGVGDEGQDITADQKRQMEAFLELALRCCEETAEDRPKMIEVAKELKHIERSLDTTPTSVVPAQDNSLEIIMNQNVDGQRNAESGSLQDQEQGNVETVRIGERVEASGALRIEEVSKGHEIVDEVKAGNASSSVSRGLGDVKNVKPTESDDGKWKLHLDTRWVVRLAIPAVIAVVVAIAIAVVKAHELHTYL